MHIDDQLRKPSYDIALVKTAANADFLGPLSPRRRQAVRTSSDLTGQKKGQK